ncbi:MAG: FG-GAP-like repeat-containing protein [Bacteroidota bacterium]|nr:FG-GAP-like repeat-containing protein [Bacteroidota bacterium]
MAASVYGSIEERVTMKHVMFLLAIGLFMPALAHGQFLFKDVTIPANIYMRSAGVADAGPGVIVFDLDGDGWDDFYCPGGLDTDKLFLNMHDGTFKNVATPGFEIHNPDRSIFPRGGSAFDYDNDGFPDIYVCCQQRDILWHNNGDGTFTDRTREANLNFPLDRNESNSSSFGDFNGDGYNDIYVARWIQEAKFLTDGPGNDTGYAHKGFPNWFYINNGNGKFTESAVQYGVDGDTGTTNIALFFDYDRDGDLDLFVGNDFGVQLTPNQVFKNMLMETGVATFKDVTKEIGLETHMFCMGIAPNDYNRDGHFDFYQTTIGPDSLMKNNGDNTYSNVSKKTLPAFNGHERHGDNKTTTWTPILQDFDNDGWEDAMIVHGFEGGISPWLANQNRLDTTIFMRNIGSFFEDYTDNALVDRFGNPMYLDILGRGAAYLDFNHDGKIDICFAALGNGLGIETRDTRLLQNITPDNEQNAHWLEMRFTAKRTAKEGIGTIVDVFAGGIIHTRQVSTGGGFGSQNSLMQHVGLGEFAKADSIVIYWPCDKYRNRTINRYYDVPADQIVQFTEDTTPKSAVGPVTAAASMQQIKVYPSPARDVLKVENMQTAGVKRFEIYDLLGVRHLDLTGTESVFTLSVNSLKPGYYTLRITSNGNTITKQFIKD